MSARYEGEVYYHYDEMLHLKSFCNKSGTLCKQDERTRFAYLIVSKAQARKITGALQDDKAVVLAIKKHFTPVLLNAIQAEDQHYVQPQKKIRNTAIKQDGKLVHLFNAPARNVSSKKMALKAQGFYAAAKADESSFEKGASKINVTYLHKDTATCNKELHEEHLAFSRDSGTRDEQESYLLVSLPYVYNYSPKNPQQPLSSMDFVLTSYPQEVSSSLLSKVQVEYGVFFDGTNNNMYNIDFFQDFKTYVLKQIKFIKLKKNPNLDKDSDQFIKSFLKHPTKKDNTIMNLLRNEVITNMRYFEKTSLHTQTDKYNVTKDSASLDSDKLFNLFVEVYQTQHKVSEGWWENLGDWFNNVSKLDMGILRDDKKLDKFVTNYLVKEVLPSSAMDSSYTNGYTNIKRLYEHYTGSDELAEQKAHIHKSQTFRLYASGSGTIDPTNKSALDDDSIFGLGLGTGEGGVKAHIIYACEKIANELRKSGTTHIDELVIDTFGFSRGSTSARHFMCTIMKEFTLLNTDGYKKYALNTEAKNPFSVFYDKEGLYTYINNKPYFNPFIPGAKGAMRKGDENEEDGTFVENKKFHNLKEITIKSIAFRHANIGDTVTHYGIKQSNDYKDLNIEFEASKIGSVFHIMAADEFRYNFEAYSIFKDEYNGIKKEEGNFKELLVPGAHADVGGGYESSPSSELVLYPSNTTLKELQKWNKEYKWINPYQSYEIDSIDKRDKEGAYRVEKENHSHARSHTTSYAPTTYSIYMYRKELSWEYELVCLKLMHDEATREDKKQGDKVPFVKILDIYKYSKSKQLKESSIRLLKLCYDELSTGKALSKEYHAELRQKFIHQSSNLYTLKNAIANKPSTEGDNIVYGERVIYGSSGKKFAFKKYS